MATTLERKRPTREEVDAHRRARIDRVFLEHSALYSVEQVGGARIERLTWRRPESGVYAVDYLCDGGAHLIVTGDLGEAIYATGRQQLRWWAACDLSYFASKCLASEYGRGYRSWDGDYACVTMGEHLRDAAALGTRGAAAKFDRLGGWDAVDGKSDWHYWLQEHGHKFFGADYYEYSDIGEVIDERCELHLVGLKRAVAALATVVQ